MNTFAINTTASIRENTLQRLRLLETLYEGGYQDEVVDRAVEKLLTHQIQKDQAQLVELQTELVKFEEQFGMDSDQFEAKYQCGEMGDDADVFEWHTLYRMATNFQFHSEALGAIHESMEALLEIGAISKTTMREFDEACLKPAKPLTPEDIRALRGVSAARNIKAPQNYDIL